MGVVESKLIVSLLDRLTGPARGVTAQINKLTAASQANAAKMTALRGQMLGAVGAGYALYKGLAAPVKAAMEFESSMADIRKVVDFATPAAFTQMGKDIRDLSLRLPMAADGIAQIVAAAGQSGLANNELLSFAEMATKVAVAWDVTSDEAGDALAKLKTALGLTVPEAGLLADALNFLSNKTAASAPDLLDFTKRAAPMASQFGLSAEQASAFGAAMIGSGFQSEVAATSFMNMGRALTKGASATKRQQAAYKRLGLSSKTVAQSMQKDATGTIQNVMARIRKVPDAMRASLISDLFGDEARALGPLITNEKLLAETLGLVADKGQYAGSAQAEFEERSKTTANSMQLFKNRVNDLGISIGNALLPALNSVLDRVGPIVTSISDLAQRFPAVTTAIVGATSALIGLKVASIGLRYAGLFMKGGLIDAGIVGLRGLSMASGAASYALAPLGRAMGLMAPSARSAAKEVVATAAATLSQRQAAYQSALALQAMASKGQVVGVSMAQATAGVRSAGAALVAAQGDMKVANAALAATGPSVGIATRAFQGLKVALIGSGVGLALVGIAAAGTWIYNNWTGISTAFEAFKGAFMRAVEPIMPAIQPVLDGFSWLWDTVSDLLGPIDEMGGGWAKAGLAAGKFVGETVKSIVELPGKIAAFAGDMLDAGIALAQSMWDGVSAKIDEMLAWFKGLPGRIIAAIGSIDIGSLIKWPSMPSWLGGGTPSGNANPDAGRAVNTMLDGMEKRASGGPVQAGRTYLVGERGPELFSPGRSGFVSPNEVYAQASVASRSQHAPVRPSIPAATINVGGIHVHGVTDAEAIAEKVVAITTRKFKEAMSGIHADIEYFPRL